MKMHLYFGECMYMAIIMIRHFMRDMTAYDEEDEEEYSDAGYMDMVRRFKKPLRT